MSYRLIAEIAIASILPRVASEHSRPRVLWDTVFPFRSHSLLQRLAAPISDSSITPHGLVYPNFFTACPLLQTLRLHPPLFQPKGFLWLPNLSDPLAIAHAARHQVHRTAARRRDRFNRLRLRLRLRLRINPFADNDARIVFALAIVALAAIARLAENLFPSKKLSSRIRPIPKCQWTIKKLSKSVQI
jgi:hypothetical protein